jgi:hypothetical protein
MAHINEVMEIVRVSKKHHFFNVLEKFYIHKESCMNNQLNEQSTAGYDRLFEKTNHWNRSR